MQDAAAYKSACAEEKDLKQRLLEVRESMKKYEARLIDHMENERIPESFRLGKASVFTREETWASAKDGDHANLVTVLESLGMRDLLPKTVNSQSLSGYVREFRDEDGEVVIASEDNPEGLHPDLAAALNITRKTKVIVTGL